MSHTKLNILLKMVHDFIPSLPSSKDTPLGPEVSGRGVLTCLARTFKALSDFLAYREGTKSARLGTTLGSYLEERVQCSHTVVSLGESSAPSTHLGMEEYPLKKLSLALVLIACCSLLAARCFCSPWAYPP